ncbi:MAG TPA: PBP1A family penicillin-binding protein [Candidatus Paceibacterota bacterium]|nr:PBP1A family penicillin-binding protein [Candidatus Paceibacterota bacterium]
MLLFWFVTTPIPDINDFETRRVPQSTKIYDRTGKVLLYDVHGSIRRTDVTLDQISPYVQHAAIAIEDPNFYTDNGIELKAILRAIWVDVTTLSFSQGGSTITQQVVKNTILTSSKTIPRKLKEWVLAIKLDQTYSKNQILDVYFNETPYGGTIYGIEEASEYFFGVHAKDLDLAQAAYLAALPQAPTYYSPYGNNKDALDARKNTVLERMYEQGYITAAERDQAQNENVTFIQESDSGIKAPHFVMYVLQYLEQKYGADAVDQNGLRVITTLDYDLEKKAEDVEKQYAASNLKEFNASNAATVAIDPNTGQILAMVGSSDYFSDTIDGKYNDALAHRQPGSTFKPFVYATAFAKGYSPDTVLFNLKTQFAANCAPDDLETTDTCYSPDNYDSLFSGPMSLRDALAQSVNVVAVKLLYLVGINDALATAQRMGITTLGDAARYGLTLTLGGGEVTLLDMVSAYGGFATDGIHHQATAILEVDDANGNVLEKYQDQSTRVLDEQVARQISDVLSDNVARTPEFGTDSPLNFPGFDVADKTGTTNDSRDAWIIGYTPSIVVGSWAGNNDNTPMAKKIAGFIVAPMWHDIMQYAIEKYPAGQFIKPDPTPANAPPIIRGQWDIPGPDGQLHSILYWLNPNTPLAGSAPGTSVTDPQYANWEYPIRIWAAAQGYASSSAAVTLNGPFRIVSPGPGSAVPVNQAVSIRIQPANGVTITSFSSYLNGALVSTAAGGQLEMSITPTTLGPQSLEIVANGSFGVSSQTVNFSTHP